MRVTRLLLLLVCTATTSLTAQVPPRTAAMLKRIFASRDFAPQRFGPARWLEDGTAYTTVEKADGIPDASDIVRYATATGARTVYLSARQLTPAGAAAPLDIEDYSWSADGKLALIFTNSERVWRQNTRGDFWVLDRAAGTLRQVGAHAPPSSLMYAKFSPRGDRVAYVSEGDLYVENVADGAVTRITTGADSLHVHGMSDWVYEEEFDLRDGFRWSPDGTRLAYWDFDMTGVGTFTLINDTDSLYPHLVPIQYPKAGTTNSAVRVGVVSAAGGPTTWIQVPGDPRENYIPRMEWVDAQELVLQRVNRRQDTDLVLIANAASGAVRTVVTETDSAWVDVVDDLTWLDGGKKFLWVSDRDGWRHAYLVNRNDGTATLLTPGAFDILNVDKVDEKGGWIYYTASPGNATQRYLFRARLNGKGNAERLSPATQSGVHSYRISPDGQWAFHTWSAFDTPPTIELVSLPDHKAARVLADNAALRTAVAPVLQRPVEFFTVPAADGSPMDGWMLKPPDFDSTRTYPLLMYVYGEVAGQTVLDSWSGASGLWYRTLAAQGYIVASVDNRGTPAPKGRHWRKQVYGQIGVISSRDQAEAVRGLTRTRAYMDPARVAIWGWSGGGSSTLQALFRYPELYQVGMSVAPVPDQRLYDTIYQERYSGLLPLNEDAYEAASPITYAEGLKGRLLIVHGSGDDNVHYQGTERLVNRLVELGKSFDFMTYPNRSHCICEGTGTTLHIYSLLTRYLSEHLPAGPMPRRPTP